MTARPSPSPAAEGGGERESPASSAAAKAKSKMRLKSERTPVRGGGSDSKARMAAKAKMMAKAAANAKGGDDEEAAAMEEMSKDPNSYTEYSMCCLHIDNPLRRACFTVASHPLFEGLIIAAILVSSVCLALDSPRIHRDDPEGRSVANPGLATVLAFGDEFIWPWLFGAELLIKSIAFGFCSGRQSYLSSSWNRLDACIVAVSFVTLLSDLYPSLSRLTNLRVLRVLRPLRLVSRNPGMKLIITSLFKALPAVANVFGVVLALQTVFAILGMQLYTGAMGACTNPAITRRDECHNARLRQLSVISPISHEISHALCPSLSPCHGRPLADPGGCDDHRTGPSALDAPRPVSCARPPRSAPETLVPYSWAHGHRRCGPCSYPC